MVRRTKAGHREPAPLPLWRLLAVSAVALTTANCAQNPQKLAAGPGGGSGVDPKYGVKASPRLYNEGEVIPKGGGRRFSGKPYVVAGRTYVPREDAKGYVREGLASWYGAAFHGRLTANGEVFDRQSIAAAHPTLPLPSYARVTNLSNGRSMIVRVNDRGPYHANRLMDVSEEVADALEFRRSGTARVRVEYAGKASTAGSDDRKLLATLRTDGQPASIRGQGPVMMADLGPDASPTPSERLARASRTALAFKQADAGEAEAAPPAAAEVQEVAPRPVRPAPVLVASAATVAVPAAVQPTAVRAEAFQPVHHPSEGHRAVAQAAPRATPLALAPPPLRLAGARPDPARAGAGRFAAASAIGQAAPTQAKAASAQAKVVLAQAKTVPPSGRTVPASGKSTPPTQAVSVRANGAASARPAVASLAAPSRAAASPQAAAKPAPTRVAGQSPAGPAAKVAPLAKGAPAGRGAVADKAAPADKAAAKPSLAAKAPARGRAQFAEAR